ncbi:uncharacterized protein C6orf136 homolog [Catharus ustulatus]|uniref:uncharacterized protein C6orf136 homolog n=1 Tax=Catharus ustulatus TaxID=91951 RepID=UPI00140D87CA|nr:uncharacterized protein C6orf136 homolog [Catharus ustulatus]
MPIYSNDPAHEREKALPIGSLREAPPLRSHMNERRVGGASAAAPRMRSRLRAAAPPATATSGTGWPPCTGTSPPPSPPPSASGPAAPGPRQRLQRPGRSRRAAATERGRRTWSPPWDPAPRWPCCPPPRCPQPRPPWSPPRGLEGLGGPVTTVDGRREDDIDVRDPPRLLLGPPPGPSPDTPGTPPGPRANPPSMEEHLATMHEKLRHELPNFFLKIPDYSLYAPDVEFQFQHFHLHTRGRPMYAVAVALCRALAWGYFASLRLEVLALTRHPEDWSVRARWRLTGLPLHLLLLRWYRRDKRTLLRSYDAISTFFLNSQGLIRCHRVDKLMPAPTAVPEPKKLLVASALALALSRP